MWDHYIFMFVCKVNIINKPYSLYSCIFLMLQKLEMYARWPFFLFASVALENTITRKTNKCKRKSVNSSPGGSCNETYLNENEIN